MGCAALMWQHHLGRAESADISPKSSLPACSIKIAVYGAVRVADRSISTAICEELLPTPFSTQILT